MLKTCKEQLLKLCGKIFHCPCTTIFHKSSAITEYCPSVRKLVLFHMYIPVKCKMPNLVLWFNPLDHEDNIIVNVIHQIQKGPKMIHLMRVLGLKSNALCKRSYIFGHLGMTHLVGEILNIHLLLILSRILKPFILMMTTYSP